MLSHKPVRTLNVRNLPKPTQAIEVQSDVALRLNLRKMHRDTFYSVDYLGRAFIVRLTNRNRLEVHELVEV